MVVLDIDADFFFYPTLHILGGEEEKKTRSEMRQTKQLPDLLDRFTIKHPEKYKILELHDAVYFVLSSGWPEVTHLIHIDAHSDLDLGDDPEDFISSGNFILHLFYDKLVDKVTWLYQDEAIEEEQKEIKVFDKTFTQMKFSDFDFTEEIDYTFFTMSDRYCLENDLVDQFDGYMQKLRKPSGFQWKV